MILRLLEYTSWNSVHLSRKMFDDSAEDIACCNRQHKKEPTLHEVDSSEYYPAFLCKACFRRLESLPVEFSSDSSKVVPWVKTYLPQKTIFDYIREDLADVKILEMKIIPEQSRHVRAIFSVSLGVIELHECMMLGDASAQPRHYSISLPGKRMGNTKRSEWRSVVKISDDELTKVIKAKALIAYLTGIEDQISARLSMDDFDLIEE